MGSSLELEIDGKLELARRTCADRPPERTERGEKWAVDGVGLCHVGAIQHVEGLDHEVELPVRFDVEELEDTDVERRRPRQPQGVPCQA